ncbi:MAG: hypothetical protein ACRD5Z_26825 [Bryobacteraceae bacterium]
MKIQFRLAIVTLATAGCLLADVSYQETVQYTGGSLIDMVRGMSNSPMGKLMGGRLSKGLKDQTSKVYLKGNKLAHIGEDSSTLIDLDAGTMTTIDNEHHSYTVMSFDDMNRQMQEMQQKMNKRGGSADVKFNAKVDATGKTREIDGKTAKEYILTVTAEGQEGAGMSVRSDMWAVPSEPGADELRDFHKRLSEKLNYAFGGGLNPMMGNAGQGLSELQKETTKLEGYPVLQDTAVSGVQSPMMRRNGSSDSNAPFITMKTQSGNFSAGSVDEAVFQIPSDYKEHKARH